MAGSKSRSLYKGSRAKSSLKQVTRGGSVRASVPTLAQDCTVKVLYSTKPGAWADHVSYLEREGGQNAHQRGSCFGVFKDSDGQYTEDFDFKARPLASRWAKEGDERAFKFFLSPANGSRVDLYRLAGSFMEQVSQDLGTKLEWAAIEHYNTSNPHLHILVRGRDEQGNSLRIDRYYMKHTARARARALVTNELGYRTERDEVRRRSREIHASRLTTLDTGLLQDARRELDGKLVVDLSESAGGLTHLQRIARMMQLERWGLAVSMAKRKWELKRYAADALRELAFARDVGKMVLRGDAAITDKGAPVAVSELKQPGAWTAGRLLKTGITKDSGDRFVVIEDVLGREHFIVDALPRGSTNDELKPGQLLEFRVSPQGEVLVRRRSLEDEEFLGQVQALYPGKAPPFVPSGTFAGKVARKVYAFVQKLRVNQGLEPLQGYEEALKAVQEQEKRRKEREGGAHLY